MPEKYKTRLENRNPPHYKQYTVWIVTESGGYKVYFNYGKIGTDGVTGVKTPKPVSWSIAVNKYERLIDEKLNKGYSKVKAGGGGNPMMMAKPAFVEPEEEPEVKDKPKPKKAKKPKDDEDEPHRSLIL